MSKTDSVNDGLASFWQSLSEPQYRVLQDLGHRLLQLVPGASETVFYGKPAVRCDAGAVVAYGVTGADCVLYLLSNRVVAEHRDLLAGWKTTTGTVRCTPDRPFPDTVLEALVRFRLRELGVVV